MTGKPPEHVLQALAFLSAAYPHFKLTRPTVLAYSVILADLPPAALQGAALQLAAAGGEWFPTAGALRNAAMDLIHADDQLPTAQEAWAEVKRAVSTYGYSRQPEWSHELVGQAVDGIGGWRTLCLANVDKDMSDRARFMQAFDVLVKRRRDDQRILPALKDYKKLQAGDVQHALQQLGKALAMPNGTEE